MFQNGELLEQVRGFLHLSIRLDDTSEEDLTITNPRHIPGTGASTSMTVCFLKNGAAKTGLLVAQNSHEIPKVKHFSLVFSHLRNCPIRQQVRTMEDNANRKCLIAFRFFVWIHFISFRIREAFSEWGGWTIKARESNKWIATKSLQTYFTITTRSGISHFGR